MIVKIIKFETKSGDESDTLTLSVTDNFEKPLSFKQTDVLRLYLEKQQAEINQDTGELMNRSIKFECGMMNYSVKLGVAGVESATLKIKIDDDDVISQIINEGFIGLFLNLGYA